MTFKRSLIIPVLAVTLLAGCGSHAAAPSPSFDSTTTTSIDTAAAINYACNDMKNYYEAWNMAVLADSLGRDLPVPPTTTTNPDEVPDAVAYATMLSDAQEQARLAAKGDPRYNQLSVTLTTFPTPATRAAFDAAKSACQATRN